MVSKAPVNNALVKPYLTHSETVGSRRALADLPPAQPAAQPAAQGSLFTFPKRPNGTLFKFSSHDGPSQGGRSRRTRRTRRTRRSHRSRRSRR